MFFISLKSESEFAEVVDLLQAVAILWIRKEGVEREFVVVPFGFEHGTPLLLVFHAFGGVEGPVALIVGGHGQLYRHDCVIS